MIIEVLGTGCAKCERLEALVKATAEDLEIPCTIEHVTDISLIVQRGVMTPPAVAIDGKIVVAGRVPSRSELTAILTSAMA